MPDPFTVGLGQQIAQTHSNPRAVFRGTLPDGRRIEARQTIGRYGSVAAVTVTLGTRLATRVAITRRPSSGKVIDDLFGGSGSPQHLPALATVDLEVTMTEPEWGHGWLARPGVVQAVLGLSHQPIAKHGMLIVLRPGALILRMLRPEQLPISGSSWASWVDLALAVLVQAEACQPPAVRVEKSRLERMADDPKAGKIVVYFVLGGTLALMLLLLGLFMIAMMMLR